MSVIAAKKVTILEPWIDEKRLPTDDELRQLAKDLEASHDGQKSQEKLSKDYELVGLIAEREFCIDFELWDGFPRKNKPEGDNGIDFWSGQYPIDVKGAQKAQYLLLPKKCQKLTIYVQYGVVVESMSGVAAGWEWGLNILRAPMRQFEKFSRPGLKCNGGLRRMWELRDVRPDR